MEIAGGQPAEESEAAVEEPSLKKSASA